MKIQKQIDVRLMRKFKVDSLRVIQYDTGVQLVFNVLDFTLPSGTTATLYVRKKSGKFVYQENGIAVSGNTVTVDLENQALTEHGETFYQLRFKNGSDIISTFSSSMWVERSLADADAVESTTVIRAFETLTAEQISQIEAATLAEIATLEVASAKQQNAIEYKGIEVLETIPADYTATHNMANSATRTKADAIICSAESDAVAVADSSDNFLRGLKVFGKSTQRTTKGKNLLNVSLTSGIYSGLTITVYDDGKITAKGTSTGGGINLQKDLTLEPGIYTFSVGSFLTMPDNNGIWVFKDGTGVASFLRNAESITFEVTQTTTVDVYLFPTSGAVWNISIYPQIETGETATAYEPYTGGKASPSPEYPQEINSVKNPVVTVCGKNLLKNIAANSTSNGITFTVNEDGSVTVDGTATAVAWLNISGKFTLPKGTYILSGCPAGGVYSSTYVLSATTAADYGNTKAFTIEEETEIVVNIGVYAGCTVNNLTFYPMIRLASVVNDTYEPYKELQTVTASHTIHGIPVSSGGNYTDANGQQWICDEIDFERGKLIQRTRKRVVSGADGEQWGAYNPASGEQVFHCYLVMQNYARRWPTTYCDRFRNVASVWERQEYGLFSDYNTSDLLYFSAPNASVTDIESWKAWLQLNPVTLVYLLATPVETDLTAAEIEAFKAIHSNYPNTTVLNDAGAWMEVKYNADTKRYIESLLLNSGSALKSTTVTLYADKWVANDSGYSQAVTMNGITANSKIDLQPSPEQLADFIADEVSLTTGNNNGNVTIYAIGGKPNTDCTIQALITEVIAV